MRSEPATGGDRDDREAASLARVVLVAVVAAALVVSPVLIEAAVASTAKEDEYTYEAVEIRVDESNIRLSRVGVSEDLYGFDCEDRPDRECNLERSLLEDNVTVRRDGVTGRARVRYAIHDGRVYRRTFREHGTNRTYGLRSVAAETALEDVAVPAEEAIEDETVRRVLEGERVTVDHLIPHRGAIAPEDYDSYPLPIYEYEGSYYVLALVSVRTYATPRPGPVLSLLGYVLPMCGLFLLPTFLRRYDRIEL